MSETKLRVNWENKKSAQKLVSPLYIVIDDYLLIKENKMR